MSNYVVIPNTSCWKSLSSVQTPDLTNQNENILLNFTQKFVDVYFFTFFDSSVLFSIPMDGNVSKPDAIFDLPWMELHAYMSM